MQLSKHSTIRSDLLESTKERHNPRLIEQQFINYKKNVSLFKKSVDEEINKLTESHKQEVKKLTQKIQKQQKIIQQYERQYGKLNKNDVSKFQNQFLQSPRKVESFYRENDKEDIKQTNYKQKKTKYIESRGIEKQTDSFMLNQTQLYTPPDQMYKSKFESSSKMKKQSNREIYETIKQNKKNIDMNTSKVLDVIINNSPTKNQKIVLNIEQKQQIQLKSALKKPKDEAQQLNSSLSFICDSLDRLSKSKSAKKKKKVEKPKVRKENLQQKKIQEQRKLNLVLRNMRDKISEKEEEPPKVQEIKQSKLLSTGEGINRGSKVLINPIPIDLTKKVEDGGIQCPSPTRTYSSILKKSSADAKLNNTIQGLSAISYHTRESRNSNRYF